MKADISILFEEPKLDTEAILEIEPLAPLSIVSTLPGSFYKSLDTPTKANLCGIFENILGWHIGKKDRNRICKKMMTIYKKKYGLAEIDKTISKTGYTSLLGHLFLIKMPRLKPYISCRYDDAWKQQLFRDEYPHPKGTPNLSYPLIPLKHKLGKKDGLISNEEIGDFFKKNKGGYPMYYTSLRKREFIVTEGNYQLKLSINSSLLEKLKQAANEYNIPYLGTNEGWVNIDIKEL